MQKSAKLVFMGLMLTNKGILNQLKRKGKLLLTKGKRAAECLGSQKLPRTR